MIHAFPRQLLSVRNYAYISISGISAQMHNKLSPRAHVIGTGYKCIYRARAYRKNPRDRTWSSCTFVATRERAPDLSRTPPTSNTTHLGWSKRYATLNIVRTHMLRFWSVVSYASVRMRVLNFNRAARKVPVYRAIFLQRWSTNIQANNCGFYFGNLWTGKCFEKSINAESGSMSQKFRTLFSRIHMIYEKEVS